MNTLGPSLTTRKVIICNAFSLQMLDFSQKSSKHVKMLAINDPRYYLKDLHTDLKTEILSAVGHKDTAAVFSESLGFVVECNRMNVTLDSETILLVGQVTGGRLPEGATTLPDGVTIQWILVYL